MWSLGCCYAPDNMYLPMQNQHSQILLFNLVIQNGFSNVWNTLPKYHIKTTYIPMEESCNLNRWESVVFWSQAKLIRQEYRLSEISKLYLDNVYRKTSVFLCSLNLSGMNHNTYKWDVSNNFLEWIRHFFLNFCFLQHS